MLCSARKFHGWPIHASDGVIGHVDQFYFDDGTWTVRYLVADTGSWLLGRKVLLPMVALGGPEWEERTLRVQLTRRQIEESPDVNTHVPVSRVFESALYGHYGWPSYWSSTTMWNLDSPMDMVPIIDAREDEPEPEAPPEDNHLQSTHDVTGYAVIAKDGDGDGTVEAGRIWDFLLDEATWAIRLLDIDTRERHTGKHVTLPPAHIERFCWEESRAYATLTRERIFDSPDFFPGKPIEPDFERLVGEYYGS